MDPTDLSRLLDILGNRNRRRIIDLLRNKPCFVTEISERLMISPKAVIDHLQMLEEARILAYHHDDKRRKYYYLEQDISIQVQLQQQKQGLIPLVLSDDQHLRISLQKLFQLIIKRDELVSGLEEIERDIDQQIGEVLLSGRRCGAGEPEMMISVALAHGAHTTQEISSMTDIAEEEVRSTLESLVEQGIACRTGTTYRLRGIYAEQSV
jgi:ArsR family transcriptional regulator